MTADRLALLAGNSPHSQALVEAAREGVLSGADLEAHLLVHASPAVFAVGMAEALFLAMQLENVVTIWRRYDNDPKVEPDFANHVEVDAEVLAALFELSTGRKACRRCLNGSIATLDAVEPEGACTTHGMWKAA